MAQILVVDEGHQVTVAESAGDARRLRERARPDLVLLDIWMPDTDGITLLKEWAASGQLTMPVVMMSGHGTIETAVEATRIGALLPRKADRPATAAEYREARVAQSGNRGSTSARTERARPLDGAR